jgi:WD40 repeat protein/uncharacterized caspase-like protein
MWAIVVGTDDTKGQAPAGHGGSARQADALARWLRGPGGWDAGHVLVLGDGGSRDPGTPQSPRSLILPTRDNLTWAFRSWLGRKARPRDLVIFYFAGRAASAVVPDSRTGERQVEYFLMPAGANPADVARTGWSLDRALDLYPGTYQVVCWLATAGSGPAAPSSASSSRDWLRRIVRWPGVTAWLASDRPADPKAAESPAVLFTRGLIEGMGQPDRRQNLPACLRSLHSDPRQKERGFTSLGGVGPELTAWAQDFGRTAAPSRPEMLLQVGHADAITALASSADGRMLVTASMDSTLRAWSVEQRALVRVLTGHAVGATALAVSRDGHWIVSGGGSGRVLVHEVAEDFAPEAVVRQPHEKRVDQVVMLPDGVHFATLDQDAHAFLWDLRQPALQPAPWLPDRECHDVRAGGDAKTGRVAVLCGDGKVLILGPAGETQEPEPIKPRSGQSTALALSPDGRWLALGRDDGHVLLRDLENRRQTDEKVAEGAIARLAFSAGGTLAVAGEAGLVAYPAARGLTPDLAARLSTTPVQALAFSPSGRALAAAFKNEGSSLWKLDGPWPPQAAPLALAKAALATGFTADERNLVLGGIDGSILIQPLDPADGPVRNIAPNRGKVKELALAPDRQHLATRNELNQVSLWDFKDRACLRLPGRWSSLAFLDGLNLAAVAAADPDDPQKGATAGWLARLDARRPEPDLRFFARSSGAYALPETTLFETLAISPDGKRIAATVPDTAVPFVAVWDARSGKLTHWLTQIQDPVRSLSFSSNGRLLATAGDSPAAALWELDPAGGEVKRPAATFALPDAANVTSVRIRPGDSHQLVTGHSDGRIILWSWRGETARVGNDRLIEQLFDGAVHALAFTPDGRYLAAAGYGPVIWLGDMQPQPHALDLHQKERPHHFEQVNALLAWPDGSLLVSASDDTTVRFWDIPKRSLRGTLATAARADADEPPARGASVEQDWVFYAPDGRFDASAQGRELVRFRRPSGQARPLEQFDASLYTFALAEHAVSGTPPALKAAGEEPPPLSVDSPQRAEATGPEAEVVVRLASKDLKDVRLYHNQVPIATDGNPPPQADGPVGEQRAKVRLVKGRNRFYAMASKEGAYDSRTSEPDLEIDYDGPMEPGLVHVVSIGVSNYKRQRLNFPGRDAESLGELLHRRGLDPSGRGGLQRVLKDAYVNVESVNDVFRELAAKVKGRPQDTVVVFLAGHTGVFDDQRFCLLLPSFPFPEQAPVEVAMRSAAPDLDPGTRLSESDYLPFSLISQNLMRLDALNRLVIVDACQADAIQFDPKVVAIQRMAEVESRRVRTSYLLAARRGEAALEVEPLGHGLFTFTLLEGMGAVSKDEEPEELQEVRLRGSADFNDDQVITTRELDRYVKEFLPRISEKFPLLVARQRAAQAQLKPAAGKPEKADQALRVQSASTTFPLFRLPAAKR